MTALRQAVSAHWHPRRGIAAVVLTPMVAAGFVALAAVPLDSLAGAWLVLATVASALSALVLASYLPARGLRPELGCSPCAALSAMTVVGASIALHRYGASLTGPALATAVTLFGLGQRLGATETCVVEGRE